MMNLHLMDRHKCSIILHSKVSHTYIHPYVHRTRLSTFSHCFFSPCDFDTFRYNTVVILNQVRIFQCDKLTL